MPIYKVDTDDKKISLSFDVAWGSNNIDDILERCLNLYNDINGVAIYKTDGTCIQKKERNIIKHN